MRFGGVLRSAARGLSAPPGVRLRILEEVGSDLEDLYAELRAAGVSEREARRRAADLLVPDREVVAALSRVHRPLWMRWRDRYGGWRHGGERVLLGGSAVVAVGGSLAVLFGSGVAVRWSPFLFVLLAIGAMALLHALGKAVSVWGAGESTANRIREGSGALLVAAAGAVVAVGFGVLYELSAAATLIEAAPEREGEIVLSWLRTSVVLCVLGLAISIVCGLCWMLFVHGAAVVEMHERVLLGPLMRVVPESRGPKKGGDGPAGGGSDNRGRNESAPVAQQLERKRNR